MSFWVSIPAFFLIFSNTKIFVIINPVSILISNSFQSFIFAIVFFFFTSTPVLKTSYKSFHTVYTDICMVTSRNKRYVTATFFWDFKNNYNMRFGERGLGKGKLGSRTFFFFEVDRENIKNTYVHVIPEIAFEYSHTRQLARTSKRNLLY